MELEEMNRELTLVRTRRLRPVSNVELLICGIYVMYP